MGIAVRVHTSDGTQPVGRGIGPALEARDLIAVLKNDITAPQDLKERALDLAGYTLEFSPEVKIGQGRKIAENILNSGKAWSKFQAICEAQGGMREIPKAQYTHTIEADDSGQIVAIDNRRIARIAKLAGAPVDKEAGVDLHTPVGSNIERGQPLYTVHSNSPGELDYALTYLKSQDKIIDIPGENP